MTRRLVYVTTILGVLLIAFWATASSAPPRDGSSGTITLEAPKALAQSSNFPVDYAGIARYIKYPPTDFQKIHIAATEIATDVKNSDGASYVWIETTSGDSSWPVFNLYADTSGWLVVFLPKSTLDSRATSSSVAYMLARKDWYGVTYSQRSHWFWSRTPSEKYSTVGYESLAVMERFAGEVGRYWPNDDLRKTKFYHFGLPSASAVHVAVEHNDSMSFFIPDGVAVVEVSVAFWVDDGQQENSLSMDENYVFRNVDSGTVHFKQVPLDTGRHEVDVSHNVMVAITVQE